VLGIHVDWQKSTGDTFKSDRERSLARANGCRSAGTLTGGLAPGAFAPAVDRRRSEPRGAPDRSRALRVEAGPRRESAVVRRKTRQCSNLRSVRGRRDERGDGRERRHLLRQGDRSERSAVKRAAHAPPARTSGRKST